MLKPYQVRGWRIVLLAWQLDNRNRYSIEIKRKWPAIHQTYSSWHRNLSHTALKRLLWTFVRLGLLMPYEAIAFEDVKAAEFRFDL